MASSVVVKNVEELSAYKNKLETLCKDLERVSDDLQSMFVSVENQLQALQVLSQAQRANWQDPQYEQLIAKIYACISAVNTTSSILKDSSCIVKNQLPNIAQSIIYISRLVQTLSSITSNVSTASTSGVYTRHLSPAEVANQWKIAVESIEIQIENYRDALLERGVPNCKWLNATLASHKAKMLEQEGYNLDVASGHGANSSHQSNAYHYPGDYSAFYDQLASEFKTFCATATNPNYNASQYNEWYVNCQRCVPTYELLRRGNDVTALPRSGGYDFLAAHPFAVWTNPQIISCSGNDQRELEDAMRSWGDGARAQVTVLWTETSGHTFIAEQRNGRTIYIDPQSGDENYSDWSDSALPGRTQFCRIDTLQPSHLIRSCIRERR